MKTKLYTEEQIKAFKDYYVTEDGFNDIMQSWEKFPDEVMGYKAITFEGDKVLALDNETGDCWVEEFNNVLVALDWLEGNCDSEGVYLTYPSFEGDKRTMDELTMDQRRGIVDMVIDYCLEYTETDALDGTIYDILTGSDDLTLEELWGIYEDEHPHLEWILDPELGEEFEIEISRKVKVRAKNKDEALKKACEGELKMSLWDVNNVFEVKIDGE